MNSTDAIFVRLKGVNYTMSRSTISRGIVVTNGFMIAFVCKQHTIYASRDIAADDDDDSSSWHEYFAHSNFFGALVPKRHAEKKSCRVNIRTTDMRIRAK